MNSVNAGNNKYCGPAALSIITGKTTDECEKLIQGIRGNRKAVTGAWMSELSQILRELGYYTHSCPSLEGQSLFFTLTRLGTVNQHKDGYYIIGTQTHFVVIEKADKLSFCDNHTKKPISAASSARLTSRVLACIYAGMK